MAGKRCWFSLWMLTLSPQGPQYICHFQLNTVLNPGPQVNINNLFFGSGLHDRIVCHGMSHLFTVIVCSTIESIDKNCIKQSLVHSSQQINELFHIILIQLNYDKTVKIAMSGLVTFICLWTHISWNIYAPFMMQYKSRQQ